MGHFECGGGRDTAYVLPCQLLELSKRSLEAFEETRSVALGNDTQELGDD
jgi:hypothetical protein